jgi:hypothetical protein
VEVLDLARNIRQAVAGASREELKQLVRVFVRRVRVGRDKTVEVELVVVVLIGTLTSLGTALNEKLKDIIDQVSGAG